MEKTSVEVTSAHGDTRVSAEHRLRLVASREDDSSENVFAAPDIIEALMKNETPYINFFVSRGNETYYFVNGIGSILSPTYSKRSGKSGVCLKTLQHCDLGFLRTSSASSNTAASQAHGDVDGAPIGYFKPHSFDSSGF